MSAPPASLNSLQQWMQQAIMSPNAASQSEASNHLDDSNRLSANQRLAIYQRSYYLRLLECMREQFPALCFALGEDLFNDFAYEYLQAYPSSSHTLYKLGEQFPQYLAQTRPDKTAEETEIWVDFMLDLANFEYTVFELFDAPGHEGKAFAQTTNTDEQLQLQPALALGHYRFPVAWYYHQVRHQKKPKLPPIETSSVALVRKDYLTHTIPITAVQYQFLLAMKNKKTVAEALNIVAIKTGLPIDQVKQSWLETDGIRAQWINAGLFTCC